MEEISGLNSAEELILFDDAFEVGAATLGADARVQGIDATLVVCLAIGADETVTSTDGFCAIGTPGTDGFCAIGAPGTDGFCTIGAPGTDVFCPLGTDATKGFLAMGGFSAIMLDGADFIASSI